MKALIPLLAFLFFGNLFAQGNLRFSYTVTNNGATTDVTVSVVNSTVTPENMAGYTIVIYYNSTQSTYQSNNTSATAALGWLPNATLVAARPNANGAIPIVHDVYTEIQVIDFNFTGTSFDQTVTPLITVTYNNVGAGSSFYLASTSEGLIALAYSDAGGNPYPIIVDQTANLPVEYLDFTATALPNFQSQLNWITSSEINNMGFVIERANKDGLEWESIGFVEGNGTTRDASAYKFIDRTPFTRENLYRLKQMDIDGTESLSQIKTLIFEDSDNMSVFPVPAVAEVNVRLLDGQVPQGDITYTIHDFNGRIVGEGNWKSSMIHKVNIDSLPVGTYHLRVNTGEQVFQKQIVKVY